MFRRSHIEQWNVWEALDEVQQRAVKEVAALSIELRGFVNPKIIERLARATTDLGWVDDEGDQCGQAQQG